MLRKNKPDRESDEQQPSLMSLIALSKRLEAPDMGLPMAKQLTEMMLLRATTDSTEGARLLGVPDAAVQVADREPNEPEFTAAKFLVFVGAFVADELEGQQATDFALLAGLFATRFPEYVEARRAPT